MEYTIRRVVPPKGKRHRVEIFLDVLKAIKGGTTRPTHIMYKTNLSWVPLREILKTLKDQALIQEVHISTRKTYFITEKGEEVLKYFEKAEKITVGWKTG